MKKILQSLLYLYRVFLAPIVGGRCRFYPSCSDYAADSLERYPWWKALYYITKRLLKCQPLCKGGVDFVS